MKTIKLISILSLFLGLAVTTSGCLDSDPGKVYLKTLSVGLGSDEAYTYLTDAEYISTPDYYLSVGDELNVQFEYMYGFEEIDGMVYPYVEQTIYNSDGEIMLEGTEEINYTPEELEDGAHIFSSLLISNPDMAGDEYVWNIKISDLEGDGYMDNDIYFGVK